jgi:hypothetical protein
MKRVTPRMLSIVIEPRKNPENTRNTRSRRAWRWDASMGWSLLDIVMRGPQPPLERGG